MQDCGLSPPAPGHFASQRRGPGGGSGRPQPCQNDCFSKLFQSVRNLGLSMDFDVLRCFWKNLHTMNFNSITLITFQFGVLGFHHVWLFFFKNKCNLCPKRNKKKTVNDRKLIFCSFEKKKNKNICWNKPVKSQKKITIFHFSIGLIKEKVLKEA